MSNIATTFLQALGGYIETAIPVLEGRVRYLYRSETAMPATSIGAPWCNLMWLGETHTPSSNQFAGLAVVEAQIQADYTIDMPTEEYGIDAAGVLYDATADLRVAIVEAFHTHVSTGSIGAFDWLDLGPIVTDFGVLRSAMGQDQGQISIRPTVRLRRAYNQR